MAEPQLAAPRLTHIALPVSDLDRSIEFYTTMTPLVVVERFADGDGESVWLSNEGQVETPFVIVLVCFNKDKGTPQPVLTPFAHIGIEVPSRRDVEDMAERARAIDALHWEPRDINNQAGYLCALRDPDGNLVEISSDQQVLRKVHQRWG